MREKKEWFAGRSLLQREDGSWWSSLPSSFHDPEQHTCCSWVPIGDMCASAFAYYNDIDMVAR